jgi:hypothetical protein
MTDKIIQKAPFYYLGLLIAVAGFLSVGLPFLGAFFGFLSPISDSPSKTDYAFMHMNDILQIFKNSSFLKYLQ